jgi:H+-transporting ATPase
VTGGAEGVGSSCITGRKIISLTFLNDIPILAIAFDNTTANEWPFRWNMQKILTVSTMSGALGVVASFGIFCPPEVSLRLPRPVVQSFLFLQLAVAGRLTIFATRTADHFWRRPFPAPLLLQSALTTKVLATRFAVDGSLSGIRLAGLKHVPTQGPDSRVVSAPDALSCS